MDGRHTRFIGVATETIQHVREEMGRREDVVLQHNHLRMEFQHRTYPFGEGPVQTLVDQSDVQAEID